MPSPDFIIQAAVAAISLLGGLWLLINAKRFDDSTNASLAGAIGIAVGGFFLSAIGFNQADTAENITRFERTAVSFGLIAIGLLPWRLCRAQGESYSKPLIAQGLLGVLLLIANTLLPHSLRFESLEIQNAARGTASIPWLYLYSAFAILSAGLCVSQSRRSSGPILIKLFASISGVVMAVAALIELVLTNREQVVFWPTQVALGLFALTAFCLELTPSQSKPPPRPVPTPQTSAPTVPAKPEIKAATTYRVLLLGLPRQGADFAAKFLSSKGHQVSAAGIEETIPDSFFDEPNLQGAVLYPQSAQAGKLFQQLGHLKQRFGSKVTLIAVGAFDEEEASPNSALASLRDATLTEPLKAMELLQAVEDPRKGRPLSSSPS